MSDPTVSMAYDVLVRAVQPYLASTRYRVTVTRDESLRGTTVGLTWKDGDQRKSIWATMGDAEFLSCLPVIEVVENWIDQYIVQHLAEWQRDREAKDGAV